MKKPLLKSILLFAATLIISCSGDSEEEPNIPVVKDPVLEDYRLTKKTESHLNDDGSLSYKIETIIDNERIVLINFLDENSMESGHYELEYNDQGNLFKQSYIEDGVLARAKEATYDDQDRIVKLTHSNIAHPTNNEEQVFSYDVEDEILVKVNLGNGSSWERKYILENGYIVKELDETGEELSLATFENENIVYQMDMVSNIYYTYENKGINPMHFYINSFGQHTFNTVLFNEFLSNATDFFAKGLIKEKNFEDADFKEINEYSLNEVDLPLTGKTFYEESGVRRHTKDIEYTYELDQ